MTQKAAGRFRCYAPPEYRDHGRRILYIGKATAGDFEDEHATERWFNNVDSHFWRFARRVSKLADPRCQDLSNLAWSNTFKLGVTYGNPSGRFAELQRESAIEELRDEVEKLRPTLIVLVNAGYYEEIPKAAYRIIDGEVGEQALTRTPVEGEEKYDLWHRPAYGTYPPILWMYHPQGKRVEYTEAALTLIGKITGWAEKMGGPLN